MRAGRVLLLFALFTALLQPAWAAVPSWVQPGVSAVYDVASASVSQGQYQNAIQTVMTITVTSVSGNAVSGTAYVESPVMPGYGQSYQWTCIEGGVCGWRFWADPNDPASSIRGPNGEIFSEKGRMPYSYGPYSTNDATVLAYTGQQNGVEYHATFDSRTGLMLAYAEIYPSQQTYMYFKSINTDLSGYVPPVGPQLPDLPGYGGPGTSAFPCAPLFVLMLVLGLACGQARVKE